MTDDAKRAPKEGCICDVCKWLRRDEEWVPVVVSREPFVGVLKRRADIASGGRIIGAPPNGFNNGIMSFVYR